MTVPTRDPDVEGFLALLAARRAPRTVEAYRRDLDALAAFLEHGPGSATTEEIESYLADLRARGLRLHHDRAPRRVRPLLLPPPAAARRPPRQPCCGARSTAPPAHAAAHPLAG